MPSLNISGKWRDQDVTLEVPAWAIPLRPIRLRINGVETASWRGYWKEGHLEILPDGSRLAAEISSAGLTMSAALKLNGEVIAAGSAPPARLSDYLRYALCLGLIFGVLSLLGQYTCLDTPLRSALVQGVASGLIFGSAIALLSWLEQRRHLQR